HHLIDHLHHVFEAILLLLRCSAEIAIRADARARSAANQPMFVQLAFDVSGIDVGGVFDWDLDAFETPAFKFREQLCAVVGEGGSEEESVNSESHSGKRG